MTQFDDDIEIFSRNLQKYNIIRSSGLVLISEKKDFERYLDLSLDDEKYKDLKILG